MSTGLLFVTAKGADHRHVNLILLHLRDWEGPLDYFHVVKSRDNSDLDLTADNPDGGSPILVPVESFTDNAWSGARIDDVEKFILHPSRQDVHCIDNGLYIIVDDEGLRNQTCILGERKFDDETDEKTDQFQRFRLHWDQATAVWANLDIANMDFLEFAGNPEERVDGGWYAFKRIADADDLRGDARETKCEALERYAREGKIPEDTGTLRVAG